MAIYGVTLTALLFLVLLYHSRGMGRFRKQLIMTGGIILVFVAGLRYMVGTDYVHYVRGYYTYLNSGPLSILSQPGITIIAKLADTINGDYATWFFLMSMIAIIPIIWSIIHYSVAPDLSLLLFVLLGCWSFTFNLVKQTASAAILVLGYKALRDRNLKRWVIICLIATMFHFSALLMIPVYFLVSKPVSKKTVFTIVLIGAMLVFFNNRLFDVASFLKQGKNLVSVNSATRNDSVSLIRVLVNCAPLLLFVFYRRRCDLQDADFRMLLNMTMLNVALNIGSMRSIYINRICVYTNVFNIFFVPAVVKRIPQREKWLVVLVMIALYTVFWWYDLQKGSTTAVFHWIFER